MRKSKTSSNSKSFNNTKGYKHNDSDPSKQEINHLKDFDSRDNKIKKNIEKSPLVQSLMKRSYTRQIEKDFKKDHRSFNSLGPN